MYQEEPELMNTDNLNTLLLGSGIAFVVAILAIRFFISFSPEIWISAFWLVPDYCRHCAVDPYLYECDAGITSFIPLHHMQIASRKVINAWCLYDWANSAYNLVITSTIFPAYYEAITKNRTAQ